MEENIIEVGRLEVHPGARGGWAVVSPATGEVLVNYADRDEAIRAAKKLIVEYPE